MKRECARLGIEEISTLKPGLDFRRPEYRREVFLRFYEFHLENRTHPGCVYFAIPWLIKKHKLDREQQLWLAFLNGNTQNIVTSWLIFSRFPNIPGSSHEVSRLTDWFNDNWKLLEWDTDRRYHKKEFLAAVDCYSHLVEDDQHAFFASVMGKGSEEEKFSLLWETLRSDFHSFGRLSAFSYSEYLRIIGLPINCPTLFLEDMSGSKSHRNGLAKVLGRDDRDWHDSTGFNGKYPEGEIEWLAAEAKQLLHEARERTRKNKNIDPREVNYFTLESAFCTYKSWHRPNRRYPNVYADMFHGRIFRAQQKWGKEVAFWWDCREECLPKHLRLESCPSDPGLVPEKQNYYREKGTPIMMSRRWPEFDNPFDRKVWLGV